MSKTDKQAKKIWRIRLMGNLNQAIIAYFSTPFFSKKKIFDIEKHLCNDLEEVTASICPEVNKAKEALLSHGAMGALMSGSGPAVFGIFPDFNKAKIAYNALLNKHNWRLFQAEMIA